MKTGRNDKINEFGQLPNYRVPGITGRCNDKIHEFCRLSNYPVPGVKSVEIVPGAKTVCYSPWKRLEMKKFISSIDFQITVYRGSRVVQIVPKAKNNALYPIKTVRNEKFMSFVDIQITVY